MHDVCISPAVCKSLSRQPIKLTVMVLLIIASVSGNALAAMNTLDPGLGNGNPVTGIFPGQIESSVSVSPVSVTLSPGAKQQFTATVTGTPNTAVSWTASSGSIDSNGLYKAPGVKSPLGVTITATSQSNGSLVAQADVTVVPENSGSLQITSSTYVQAQTESTLSLAFAATGGTSPYSWGKSSGQLPTGVSLSTSGNLTGTPTSVGVFTFGITVTDATGLTASATISMTVNQASGYDGPAQLPLINIPIAMSNSPAPGSVIHVNPSDDMQSILNSVRCGQTIQLQAGATYTGQYLVQPRNCDASNWIIIRTSAPDSALPAEGQRLTPCYAGVTSLLGRPAYPCSNPQNVLAKVQNNSTGNGPFIIASGANFYRFVGLEITRPVGAPGSGRLISFQGTADHIFVDRCWLHGQPQDETYDGVAAGGGTNIAVFDSYLNDFHCIAVTGSCTDSHAISGGVTTTQDGPYLIQNNFLEASGEAIMFGGGPATKTPTDITIQYNHFWKPWQWMPGNTPFVGGSDGHPFIVKNHLELKNAVRVLVHGNLMDNVWAGFSQYGHGIVLNPANQHNRRTGQNVCPLCQVTDVTIRYSQVSHAGGGLSMATDISPNRIQGAQALAGTRWSVHDIVMDDLRWNLGGGDGFKILNTWSKNPLNTLTINHTTVFPDPKSHLIGVSSWDNVAQMYGFVFINNLGTTGEFPLANILGPGSCALGDVPITVLSTCFTTFAFQSNGLIASPPPPSSWPKRNFFPESPATVQFVDYNDGNGGNYTLSADSPYVNAGTDGKNLGADIAGLTTALQGVE